MCFICDGTPLNNKTIRNFTLDISQCSRIVTVSKLPKIIRHLICSKCPNLEKIEGFLGTLKSLNCSYNLKLKKLKVPDTIEELNCYSCDNLEKIIIQSTDNKPKWCKYIYASDCPLLTKIKAKYVNIISCRRCISLDTLKVEYVKRIYCAKCPALNLSDEFIDKCDYVTEYYWENFRKRDYIKEMKKQVTEFDIDEYHKMRYDAKNYATDLVKQIILQDIWYELGKLQLDHSDIPNYIFGKSNKTLSQILREENEIKREQEEKIRIREERKQQREERKQQRVISQQEDSDDEPNIYTEAESILESFITALQQVSQNCVTKEKKLIDQLKEMKDDTTNIEEKKCIVCMENEKAIAFDCGHRPMCVACTKVLVENGSPKCPICRHQFKSILRVFT
jgi:hypothetical protein